MEKGDQPIPWQIISYREMVNQCQSQLRFHATLHGYLPGNGSSNDSVTWTYQPFCGNHVDGGSTGTTQGILLQVL